MGQHFFELFLNNHKRQVAKGSDCNKSLIKNQINLFLGQNTRLAGLAARGLSLNCNRVEEKPETEKRDL